MTKKKALTFVRAFYCAGNSYQTYVLIKLTKIKKPNKNGIWQDF
jgi:hypothetical protein